MSGTNVQVIPASVLRFWRYFIFKYVLFVAQYLICAIDVNAGEKGNFWKQFWSRRTQCIKTAPTSRRPHVVLSQRREVGSTYIEVNKRQRRDVSTSRHLNVVTSRRLNVATSQRCDVSTLRRLNIVTSQCRDVATSRCQRELFLSIIKRKIGTIIQGGVGDRGRTN